MNFMVVVPLMSRINFDIQISSLEMELGVDILLISQLLCIWPRLVGAAWYDYPVVKRNNAARFRQPLYMTCSYL